MNILFFHPDCNKPYNDRALKEGGLGGTEATVVRISEGLAAAGHHVSVSQGERASFDHSPGGVQYIPNILTHPPILPAIFTHVIMVDVEKLLPKLSNIFPESHLYLWIHCFPGKRRRKKIRPLLQKTGACMVAVSQSHLRFLEECTESLRYDDPSDVRAAFQYNPVDDDLVPDQTPVDPTKLVFLSSPHKGIWMVFDAFREVKKQRPEMKLYIADPGYMKGYQPGDLPEGVIKLGSLPHHEVIAHMRSAFCLFYPQSFFKETFGLVFAEANAVGTPVLAHPHGAAPEVLKSDCQLVNADKKDDVLQHLLAWINEGRPEVALSKEFRLSNVLKSWEKMFRSDANTGKTDASCLDKDVA
jgi:glycosyltransferase involved in cell wall biosynthesis